MHTIIRSSRALARAMCLMIIVMLECAPDAHAQSPGAMAPAPVDTLEPAAESAEHTQRRTNMTLLGGVMGVPAGIILGLGESLVALVALNDSSSCPEDGCGHAQAIVSMYVVVGSGVGGGVLGGITGGIAGYQASNPAGGPQGARYLLTPTVTGAAIGLGIGLIGSTRFCLTQYSVVSECLPTAAATTALLLIDGALVGLGSAAGPGALIRHLEWRKRTAEGASLELSVLPTMFIAHRDGPRMPGLVLSGRF